MAAMPNRECGTKRDMTSLSYVPRKFVDQLDEEAAELAYYEELQLRLDNEEADEADYDPEMGTVKDLEDSWARWKEENELIEHDHREAMREKMRNDVIMRDELAILAPRSLQRNSTVSRWNTLAHPKLLERANVATSTISAVLCCVAGRLRYSRRFLSTCTKVFTTWITTHSLPPPTTCCTRTCTC